MPGARGPATTAPTPARSTGAPPPQFDPTRRRQSLGKAWNERQTLLPPKRSLVCCSPGGREELGATERLRQGQVATSQTAPPWGLRAAGASLRSPGHQALGMRETRMPGQWLRRKGVHCLCEA